MKVQDDKHEINAILLQNLIEMRNNKWVGKIANNARKGPSKVE